MGNCIQLLAVASIVQRALVNLANAYGFAKFQPPKYLQLQISVTVVSSACSTSHVAGGQDCLL